MRINTIDNQEKAFFLSIVKYDWAKQYWPWGKACPSLSWVAQKLMDFDSNWLLTAWKCLTLEALIAATNAEHRSKPKSGLHNELL